MASGYKSDAPHSAGSGVAGEDVPSRIQHLVEDVLKVYSTKNTEEQAAIVNKHYAEDAHFVDPLMDVKTPREINLAFLSLIKLFKEVKMEQKSITLNPKPRLPSGFEARNTQQFLVNNRQLYTLERSNPVSRCILPGSVDLDVNTYLTVSQESGRVVYHEDVWNNKGFGTPGFLKPANGVLSSWAFKIAGWGKEVDKAKFRSQR
jgi:hypothetical protein